MHRRHMTLFMPVLLALSACSKHDAESDRATAQVEHGATLFQQHCSECHPRSGRGDYLKRIPVTLLTRRSEEELIAWIQGSEKHREMPSFTNLDEVEKTALAAYLLSQIQPARP